MFKMTVSKITIFVYESKIITKLMSDLKNNNFLKYFLFLLIYFSGHFAFSQAFILNMNGRVFAGKSLGQNATIKVIKDGVEIQTLKPNAKGEFTIECLPDANYFIECSHEGFFPKIVQVNTKDVPADAGSKDGKPVVYTALFETVLYEEIAGVDFNFLKTTPIGKMMWKINGFDYDMDYTDQMQNRITEVSKVYDQALKDQEFLKKQFETSIAKGDKYLAAQNLPLAEQAYKEALLIKPNDASAKNKLNDVQNTIKNKEAEQESDIAYQDEIDKGDEAFENKKYKEALKYFQNAQKLKPNEAYAKNQIAAVQLAMGGAQDAELDAKYLAAIEAAQKQFDQKNYSDSKTLYQEALSYKPKEKIPADKIKEIDKIFAVDEQFKTFVAEADKLFQTKAYTDAKVNYEKAKGLKPNEKYPIDQVAAIDKILNEQNAQKDALAKYTAAIQKGDKAMVARDFNAAKTAFNEAVALNSEETYPKTKLAEIEKLMADVLAAQKLDADYSAAIKKADEALTAKNLNDAKTEFNNALALKPNEAYPKTKLAEIEKLFANDLAAKELDEKYKKAIADGDAAFNSKEYASAKTSFNFALTLRAKEMYPANKIKEIDAILLAEQKAKETESQYLLLISDADKAFDAKDFANAKVNYNKALTLKTTETYPKSRITEIDNLLAKDAEAKLKLEKYQASIAKADKAFAAKEYVGAKAFYNEALSFNSTEEYPKTKLAEIDKILADALAAQKLEADYIAIIKKGDLAFASKNLNDAKTEFNNALALKPNETYPKTKLAEIEKLLANDLAAKELDEKFKKALADGDLAFNSKDYTAAKTAFNNALALKSKEVYPANKIKEIDAILLAEQKAKEAEALYVSLIAEADKAFDAKDFANAKVNYNKALALKTTETHPKNRITEIDNLLAKDAEAKLKLEKYQASIAKADKAFAAKEYVGAKAFYNEALSFNATEEYPKNKLAEIDKILADALAAQKLEADYAAIIKKGDVAFTAKNLNEAKTEFNNALALKPNETYPKTKIQEIDNLMALDAKEKEKNQQYQTLITKADGFLTSKNYDEAKKTYQESLVLKPGEKYPTDKLKEIDLALAEIAKQKDLETKFTGFVETADKMLAAKDYTNASANYKKALELKANETYPQEKLKEIEGILAAIALEKENDKKYSDLVKEADKLFLARDLENAKTKFNDALALRPNEQYPKTKIQEIDADLDRAKNKETEKEYRSLLMKADMALNAKKYNDALKNFEDALVLKPDENYPKTKIEEINKIINKETPKVIEGTEVELAENAKDKDKFLSDLAKKYPQGVTEEIINQSNRKIIRRVVVKDNIATEYTRVIYSFGTYYFKNGNAITEGVWNADTK